MAEQSAAMETREDATPPDGSLATTRLETFADGVMAIAITLLILEIDVPHAEPGGSLGSALARQWPSYAAYVVSFLTIGIIWINHHHLFSVVIRGAIATGVALIEPWWSLALYALFALYWMLPHSGPSPAALKRD